MLIGLCFSTLINVKMKNKQPSAPYTLFLSLKASPQGVVSDYASKHRDILMSCSHACLCSHRDQTFALHCTSETITQFADYGWNPGHQAGGIFGCQRLNRWLCRACRVKWGSHKWLGVGSASCLNVDPCLFLEDILSRDSGECTICLEELEQGDTIARLPCLCIYHKG